MFKPSNNCHGFYICLRKEGYQLKDNESTDNKSVYNCNICNVGEIFFVLQLRKLAVNWKRVWRACVSCMCMVCAFVCVGGWVSGCESFIRDLPPSPSLPHTECGMDEALKEVDSAIQRLFYYGAYADKYGGSVQETTLYGATVRIHEPVGTLGIACPDEFPLLGFVSLFAPAVIRGNTIVIIPSETYPLSATDLYQVFDTSDLPGGVVNIVTGSKDHLTKYLVEHQVS